MLDPERQKQVEEIFHQACDLPGAEQSAFLDRACGQDSELRAAVQALIDADQGSRNLPPPPMQGVLKEMHEVADLLNENPTSSDQESGAESLVCEQCGAELGSTAQGMVAVCTACGETRTMELAAAGFSNSPAAQLPARFTVKKMLGEGSFGVVYKAWDERLQRDVALKIPKSEIVSRVLFVREAQIASKLRHENIVTIHDVNDEDDFAYFVSDFIPGTSLNRWKRQHPLDLRQSCQLCIQIANAMEHAHQHGVVHRDLKPSNIVMDASDAPNVLDFGLSKSISSDEGSLVHPGSPIGTPGFMSPEQVRGDGDAIGPASDVYSLGVILYQLLADRLPFSGEDIFEDICNKSDPSIERTPPAMNAIVQKALAKDPADRYPTAGAFAMDLQRFLDGRRVNAYPKIDARVLIGTARRWSVAAVILILLAAAIAFAYGYISGLSEETEKIVLVSSEPDTQLEWYRIDPTTGRQETRAAATRPAGKRVRLPVGYYKVVATANGIRNEVFRTVPGQKTRPMYNFVGVYLRHRNWDDKLDPIELAPLEMVDSSNQTMVANDFATALKVPGGKLTVGGSENISPFLRNLETEIKSFRISTREFNINEIKKLFPKTNFTDLNYDICAAFAEQVGASLPTMEEYAYLDQQGIALPGLRTGLKEWTETPFLGFTIESLDATYEQQTDLGQRLILGSTASPPLLNKDPPPSRIVFTDFVAPQLCDQPEPNTGFRLVWRD